MNDQPATASPAPVPSGSKPRTILGFRLAALVEALVILGFMTLLDLLVLDGHRYWDMNPHPFWLAVLLLAVQYGTNEGLLGAVLATLFYLVGNLPPLGEGLGEYGRLYAISINPILWFVVGWIIGEIRQRHVRERDYLLRELGESHQREQVISESYKFVRTRKESLEVQVAGQLSSSIEAYRAAKAVETLDPQSVLQGVERLVKSILGAQKFSLFLLQDNKLTATLLHGWNADEPYAQELDSYSPLYQAVVGNRETLVIANEQQELSLADQGLMAAPVLDPETNEVIGLLKVEQMEFASLSLHTVETFRALTEWVGTALVNARNYQMVKSEAMINPQRKVLSYSYFRRQSDYLSKLAKRVGFDLSMLIIKVNDAKNLTDADRVTIARQVGESVKSVLRSVDLAFDYQTDGEEYSILLPATPQAGAQIVRDKIARDIERNLRLSFPVQLNYIVQAIHESR